MKVKRRTIIKSGTFALAAMATSGCQSLVDRIDQRFNNGIPAELEVAQSESIDPDFHFLSRLSFGPAPGDLERLKAIGQSKWLDEQLNYQSIDDTFSCFRTRRFESRFLSKGDCFDIKKEVLRSDLVRHTLLKSIYSKRQLLELMISFWNDHLNINVEKGNCVYFKTLDDKDVVRKNALGNFRELIKASALSAAMLEYLDGKDNKKSTSSDVPNENYARELLELHTLGVNGGYTQKDVFEAARCLTGWRIKEKFGRGQVYFDSSHHDQGEKVVLGKVIRANGGKEDLERLLDIVCNHKSTANHIAFKLTSFFVRRDPPSNLVALASHQFQTTKGDIKSVLRVIIESSQFQASRGTNFKRPYRFMVSAFRALKASTNCKDDVLEYLTRMGQEPFQHPTPDGFPTESLPWMGTLLWRWNFALGLPSNQIKSVKVDSKKLVAAILQNQDSKSQTRLLFQYFIGRLPQENETEIFQTYIANSKKQLQDLDLQKELIGLILASPAFQRY